MATIITTPIIVKRHHYTHSGPSKFIESHDDSLININAASEGGVYKSYSGEYWIWFYIDGHSKYYAYPFKTKEEAKKALIELISEEA